MAGTKRTADDSGAGPTTRASKAAKTGNGTSPASKAKKGGKKGGAKATLPASAFKSKALPLHVNITHTPPSIADDESVPAANADPGFLSAVTLTATSFNTGSYGWKGSKRFTVELQGSGDEKEKVQVMLSINATVVGSKQAPGDGEEAEEKEETAKEDEKTADEEEKEADEEKKAADEE